MIEPTAERMLLRDAVRASELQRMLAAAAVAIAVTASIETARLPSRLARTAFELVVGTYAFSVVHVVTDLAPAVALLPLLGLVTAWQQYGFRIRPGGAAHSGPRARRLARGLRLVLVAAAVGSAFRVLALYPDFAVYPPAWLAFGGLFVALAITLVPTPAEIEAVRRTWVRVGFRLGVPLAALAAATGCYAIDIVAYRNDYPTLHASLLQVGHLLLSVALWRASALWRAAGLPRIPAKLGLAAWALLAGLGALAVWTEASPWGRRAYPHWASRTTLGQTQTVLRTYREPKGSGDTAVLDEPRATALFREHARLPALPAGFDLLRYNVLLMVSEATRFDQTSLGRGGPKTTPQLSRFQRRGAFSFTRAQSPSSGTFQSVAGMFGMSYPSFLNLEVWRKAWQGQYLDKHPLPAELFAAAGYETFWIGHNKATCFTKTVLGFDRGFKRRDLLSNRQSAALDADELIATSVIERLRAASKDNQRFFGWAFFVSPHSGYEAHYPDRPADSDLDRYRQEVSFLDAQIGKIIRELDKLGRLADTIVIYTADHGEEFLDHGGRWHKSTIYTEVTHVPLLVWLPGVRGRTLTAATSTIYLFPWLFQHGSPAMRRAALHRLRSDIGPMLERTSGAVVTELLGPDRMLSSLDYNTRKFYYDFNSRLHQAYRVDRDPLEQADVFEIDPQLAEEAGARIAAYRGVRGDRHAFVLRSDKRDPRPGSRRVD